MEVDENCAAFQLQNAAAVLLSDIKNVCKTTQKTVDVLVSSVNVLMGHYLEVLKEKIFAECSKWDGNITLENIYSVLQAFKGQSVFEGVGTQASLDCYLQKQSRGSQVLLKGVEFEYKTVLRKGLPRKVPTKVGYTVPFLPQLEQLLNCQDVLECVDNPHPVKEGVFQTVTDGLFYQYHPVVQEHGPQTLCFFVHVDDAEVCDPLKSKANKHSIRLFYWVLGNIHPEKRSTLKAINLLAIVKAKVAKEKGNEHFLQDFINGMKRLGSEGVEMNIGGAVRRFHGVLLFGSADNPAAANLGGFKETHSALRPCRACMVKSKDLNESFVQSQGLLRKIDEHEQQLQQVLLHNAKQTNTSPKVTVIDIYENEEKEEDDDSDIEVSDEKYLDHKNPSINFGLNSRSALADCPGFDVTKCFPQDIMHVLAEGIVELLCRRILKDMCIPAVPPGEKKRVKAPLCLKYINQVIETSCDLGHQNVSRPSRIELSHLKGSKLKQSAAQMLVLLHLLPFLIYRVCSQEKLALVTKLIRLVNLCMSFELSQDDVSRIGHMVEEYGTSFVKIYPNVKSLKLHCLVHLPMQVKLFGPLRQQWCFRFEAMHSKFTSIAPVIRSKKNIALSCASRYLSARNTEIVKGKATGNYLCDGDTIKSPTPFVIRVLPERDCLLGKFHDLDEDSDVIEVKQVLKQGQKWHKGVVILLEKNGQYSLFGRIDKIYVNQRQFIFVYNEYVTKFVASLNAYEIVRCDSQFKAITLSELMHPFAITRFSFNLHGNRKAFILMQSPGGNV